MSWVARGQMIERTESPKAQMRRMQAARRAWVEAWRDARLRLRGGGPRPRRVGGLVQHCLWRGFESQSRLRSTFRDTGSLARRETWPVRLGRGRLERLRVCKAVAMKEILMLLAMSKQATVPSIVERLTSSSTFVWGFR